MSQVQSLQFLFQQAPNDKNKLITLLQIGRKKGFGSFVNRKQIWPFLFGVDTKKVKEAPVFQWRGGMDRTSSDFDQLMKDAERSLSSMKTFEDITKFHLKKKQEAVLSVLDTFFAKNSDLRYIQGFHDVASIFLILFGNSTGYYLIQKAGRTYFYDFLCFQFGEVGRAVSQIVYDIVTQVDPQFKTIFSTFQTTQFLIFIIPWILTWFAHNFSSVKTICRIWDYLICTGPHAVFYLTAAIILSTKTELLQNCEEFDDPNIQTFYQELAKKQGINIEKAIALSIQLEKMIEVENTKGYNKLDERSLFRYSNFVKQNNVHLEYYKEIKNRERTKKKIVKIVKVGGILLATTAVLLAFKHSDKIKSLAFGQL